MLRGASRNLVETASKHGMAIIKTSPQQMPPTRHACQTKPNQTMNLSLDQKKIKDVLRTKETIQNSGSIRGAEPRRDEMPCERHKTFRMHACPPSNRIAGDNEITLISVAILQSLCLISLVTRHVVPDSDYSTSKWLSLKT